MRDLCIFARQDLTRDPPFCRLDLIVCRNVLIYLGPVLQKKLMTVFHYALKPAGFLMLGRAETIGPHADLFRWSTSGTGSTQEALRRARPRDRVRPAADAPPTHGARRRRAGRARASRAASRTRPTASCSSATPRRA